MTSLFYLILRRMRGPLILIVVVYTLCTCGLALMPGVDAAGRPSEGMGLFHAFYVISYTGTTIGFGEIPTAYSPAQRLWMIISIYSTVLGWSYAVVNVLSLIAEPAFRHALSASRFARQVARMREPFYIVCGYGETGRLVCQGLDRLNLRFVIVERDSARIDEARLDEYRVIPPKMVGDAAQPALLDEAGLRSPHCRGVMALALEDETNQAIAVACRLLRPDLPVLARIRDPDFETHLGVFGGDIVINPFARFAEHLSSALVAPQQYRLREILTALPDQPLPTLHTPPRGHWIMCGYGRFGHAIVKELRDAGQTVTVVDMAHYGEGDVDVKGRGTEPGTLEKAGIDRAVGIVIGNRSDQKNLAIAVQARDLRPSIYVVVRQNQTGSAPLFEAFDEDLVMEPSRLVAREFLAVITTPLLARFLDRLPTRSELACSDLTRMVERLYPRHVPENWGVAIDPHQSPAVCRVLDEGGTVRLADLLAHPSRDQQRLRALPLMLARNDVLTTLPESTVALERGDEVLFVGHPRARRDQELTLINDNVLSFVRTGEDQSTSWVWQHLVARSARAKRP